MYRLGKRVISQYIRTGCQRRLRLDLYANRDSRDQADVPPKDAMRPGLALLTQQGREYERAKFSELENIFPDLVIRGALKNFQIEEDRAFQPIKLGDHIDRLTVNQLALEAQFCVTQSFKTAHVLDDLENGSAMVDGQPLTFDDLRPDIIQVLAGTDEPRRIITPAGRLEWIGTGDTRLGLRIIDIKIAGEPSPAHFSELAYYGMVLAGWLEDTDRADRFVVLAQAAIWPGAHEGSTIQRMQREDRARNLPLLDLQRYLGGLENDLEAMPPEVVLGRVQRFLTVDLREVLAEQEWRQLPWHIDSRCSGCDYLGYRWSRHDNNDAEVGPPRGTPPDARYCWPTAERTGHLSRITGLTEGASGRLREAQVDSIQAVSMLSVGSPAFERHQTLRAKRTVLSARATTLRDHTPAAIPDRAGTSAILPRFADIRVAVSADFDVGSGFTFALGYRLNYGVPIAERPIAERGARFERRSERVERPMLVYDRTLTSEGETLHIWLTHLVNDIFRAHGQILAGYRANGVPNKRDATIQFYLWDRLTFDHLCRVFGRHLDRLRAPVIVGATNLNPMAWIFPSEGVLDEPDFVSRSSPITIVSDAVNSLITAPIPHHYGMIDLANNLEPLTRVLPDGRPWWFHVDKYYRDPLSDQIPSERGQEVWDEASPFPDKDFQWHQEQVRHVVKRKLHAIIYVADKLTNLLGADLAAEAPGVDNVFVPNPRQCPAYLSTLPRVAAEQTGEHEHGEGDEVQARQRGG